jgi:hypothetical protein
VKTLSALASTLFASLLITCSALAVGRGDQTRFLGATRLTKIENDVDVVKFQACQANVNAVQLRVRGGNAEIETVWLRFANGERETLSVRSRIARDQRSRWIDVNGGERCVSAFGVVGDTEASRKQAKVELFAR